MVDYFSQYKDDGIRGVDITPWIAYLEKQKEPIPIPDKFSGLKSLMLQYLQSAANRKDDTEIESDTDLWGRKILDYVWKQDEKQKEQKPAEWDEEDEDIRQSIIKNIKWERDNTPVTVNKDIRKYDKQINWLKSLPMRCPKKSDNWKPSKEQMRALERAIIRFNSVDDIPILTELRDKLKKL